MSRRDWITAAVLFLLTFAVFSGVLRAQFVQWDDDISVERNAQVHGLTWPRLHWMFTDSSYAMRYKPLTWLTYAVVYEFGGLKPFNYHLLSVLLHSLNAVLAFVIIRRLLALGASDGTPAERWERGRLPAGIAALLWAINPLRVEPVARITDLTYELVFFWVTISFWCYLRAQEARENDARRLRSWLSVSVAAYAVAMLCYPFAFAWGLVLLIIDWYPLRRFQNQPFWQRLHELLREKVLFFICGAIILTTLLARRDPSVTWIEPAASAGLSGFERVMQVLYVWAYYIWKPWVPFHLSPVYTTLVQFDANGWRFWLSAALVLGLTLGLVFLWRRSAKGTAIGPSSAAAALAVWLAYLILLLPALGMTEHPHYTSDRYDYIPGLIWALVLAAILWKISARSTGFTVGVICALALAVCWVNLSFQQTRVWRTTLTLFEYMVKELGESPHRSDVRRRLGGLYANAGRFDDAVRQYQASLRLAPAAKTYQAAAELFERNGDAAAALTNYLGWLKFESDPLIHLRTAVQLSQLGRRAEAIAHYRAALEARPDFPPALEKLAWILASDSDAANRNGVEAVRIVEQSAASGRLPSPAILGALAAAYAETGEFPKAIATAQKASVQAQESGDAKLAGKCQEMVRQFQSRQPWREPHSPP